jgi:hypothetical protein
VPASRFQPADCRAASRQSALTLAREARALSNDVRWAYLRALRTAARRDEELRLAAWERPAGIARLLEVADDWERVELVAKLRFDGTAIEDVFVLRQPVRVSRQPVQGRRRRGGAHVGIRRGLPAFAFAGVLAGMAAAVVLPSSLSEKLPGTTGNGNENGGGAADTVGAGGRAGTAGGGGARGLQIGRSFAARGGGSRFNATGSRGPTRLRAGRRSGDSHTRRRSSRSRSNRRSTRSGPNRGVARKLAIGLGSFSGTGDKRLGTLRINRPTILTWSTGGQSFQISSEAWRFHPHQRKGSTVLTPGTYRRFAVKSTTSWKLSLSRAR